jgi:hypothetical protein
MLPAQEKINISVKQGEDINSLLSDSQFLFSEFQPVQVYLKKGGASKAQMNYNLLTSEMLFIDDKGDTLALSNIADISQIAFDKRRFIHTSKGFLELLASSPTGAELLTARSIKKADRKKIGAYGMVSGVSSIENVNTLSDNFETRKLDAHEVLLFRRINIFYLSTDGRKYRVANRSAFLKTFSAHKPKIEEYLQQQPVDFTQEEEVIRLFNFCVTNQ